MRVAAKKRETGGKMQDGAVSGWQVVDAHVGPEMESPPLPAGELVAGKYDLERVLASGGMGVVWLARHVELEQHVAIKFLKQELVSSEALVARFLEEARAAAALCSEHIVRVIDVGVLRSKVPYFIMEYLDGTDLETLVREQGPLDPDSAIDYVLQACEALIEAHGSAIVHRDVKPENLFLIRRPGKRPIVKVVDFGIAKRMDSVRSRVVTAPQDNMGSPCYMSPEQMASPQGIDARTDIWSLGVVLYQLLTGTLPFDGETVVEVFARVVNAPPRPLYELRPEIDAHLDGIVRRCLEKEPDSRFQTVTALADALAMYRAATFGNAERRSTPVPLFSDGAPSESNSAPYSATIPSPSSRADMTSTAPVALCRVSSRPKARIRHVRKTNAAAVAVWMFAIGGMAAYAKTVPGIARLREVTPSWLYPAILGRDDAESDTATLAAAEGTGTSYPVSPLGVISSDPAGAPFLEGVPEVGKDVDASEPSDADDVEVGASPRVVLVPPSEHPRGSDLSATRTRAYRDYLDRHGYRPLREVLRDLPKGPPRDAATQIAAPRVAPPKTDVVKEELPDDLPDELKDPAPADEAPAPKDGEGNAATPHDAPAPAPSAGAPHASNANDDPDGGSSPL